MRGRMSRIYRENDVTDVRLSVRLSITLINCDTTRKGNHSSFLTPTAVSGRRPFHLKFALKVTYIPFEKRRFRQISVHNVSTVRDSEKSYTRNGNNYSNALVLKAA